MVRMATAANPLDDPGDAAALATYAGALADAIVVALPRWVERTVEDRYRALLGEPPPAVVTAAAARAGRTVVADLEPDLRTLLATDVDEQRSNPLAIVRRAVPAVTTVLRDAGVPPVDRDPDAQRLFPDDDYDVAPAAFADLDPSVHEPGLVWGAAKAHVVLRRRRSAGG
jgi:hypothetical protein